MEESSRQEQWSRRSRCRAPGKIAVAMAKVSVIIPVYNGAATIGRALASVFAQTFTDYEVVVVNDGSTDNSASVLAGYGDRIRVVTRAKRGGARSGSGVRAGLRRSAQGRPRGQADARPERRERGRRISDDGADARASMGGGAEPRHGASSDPRSMRRI